MTDEDNFIYRVLFHQDNKIYEVYAKYISEESLVGFLEIDELIFHETRSGILVDPGEEKLREEFKGVQRSYIPTHLIVRIDEVKKQGISSVKDLKSNVSRFPGKSKRHERSEDSNE